MTDNKKWTVSGLYDEDSEDLLISGVFPGHQYDKSSTNYTTRIFYRFLRFVEAPTADDAERLVMDRFEAAGREEDDMGTAA
ncbi:hypothetical protein [Streptomyces nitrosporeus]|uniref:hypothetical protein n=1 Tax=Streptomyces nitrosporeus TaxID=28894 RepID=UPI0033290E23